MIETDKQILSEIQDIASSIGENTAGIGYNDFVNNRKLLIETVQKLTYLVDHAEKLNSEAEIKFPGIPWKDIRELKPGLLENRDDDSFDFVWDFIRHHIPTIEKRIRLI